jgi:hypothetical protein
VNDSALKELKNKNPTGIFPFIEQGEGENAVIVPNVIPICKHLARSAKPALLGSSPLH